MKNEFDVKVQNIVAFTALGRPISLEKVMKVADNTEYKPEQFPGLIYRMTDPKAAALIFSQGKIVCTGTKNLDDLNIAMKNVVDKIRKAGTVIPRKYNVKVENVVASARIKADLRLDDIAFALENSEYEPEQFPGLVYRIPEPRAAFLLFSSGRIICTGAQNVESVHIALGKFKKKLEGIGIKVVPLKDTPKPEKGSPDEKEPKRSPKKMKNN